jgi:hypothetical protein
MGAEEYDGLKPRRERMRMRNTLSSYVDRVLSTITQGQEILVAMNRYLKAGTDYDIFPLRRVAPNPKVGHLTLRDTPHSSQ